MRCLRPAAAIALFGLPSAVKDGLGGIVQWIAQTFLQLVLLSIIIVGQNVQAAASDLRAENTYQDAEAVLHEALQIRNTCSPRIGNSRGLSPRCADLRLCRPARTGRPSGPPVTRIVSHGRTAPAWAGPPRGREVRQGRPAA